MAFNQLTIHVEPSRIVEVVKYLRDDPACRFINFTDITAVDYPDREKRFDVVYHLLSPTLNTRIRLKAEADETTQVPSIIEVFPGADWFERETYDLYGVIFTGHPDMRRLLTDYGFDGHPLRKDFPLEGKSSDVPDVAFTRPAPLAGGPFVTVPTAAGTKDREPRARRPEDNESTPDESDQPA